ncbi:hypothetical protein [Janthinobacterium fluminis]|uniref:Uncharacterized protein n=1 Tax=Janthinobacterium fluminis TaxID=2987524 RepID=A0ABT5K595_9BURK|nr:hypothetical protein [Janthinobacterium fluminis]MDC8759266.1 hypothetical protein [Janthinobacterium fluminis]
MKYAAFAAFLLCNTASATGLDDLKAALAPLQGQGVLRGTYEAREQKTDLEKNGAKPELAQVSALVEDDAGGLQIHWDRALLKRAADESRPAKGKKSDALTQAIGSSSAPRIAAAVNYAPKLLQQLASSQLKQERVDTYQGKPARLLEINFTPPDEDNDKVKVKENTHLAQVWLGADGLPLAASVTHKVKVSFMVFLSYETTSKEELLFSAQANRLVVLRREEQGNEKGMGSEGKFSRLYTFTPKG